MDLRRVFLLSIVAGALLALVYFRDTDRNSHTDPDTRAKIAGSTESAPEPKSASPPPPAPRTDDLAANAASHGAETAARSKAQKTAERLAADEPLTREELTTTLKRTFESKLHDRELTPSDYDRLADSVFKIRASQRVLQGMPESDDTSAVRAIYMAQVRTAFAEVQDILGMPPSQLGDVLGESSEEAPN